MTVRAPASLVSAWDRASPRERLLLRWAGAIVVLALLYALAWQPITRDIARTREAVTRDRATLTLLQGYAQTRPGAPQATSSGVRAAVERALDARGLRNAASASDAGPERVSLLFTGVPFDALIDVLDELARDDHVRVLEARLTARVEPGMVRAELTLGR